MTERDKKPLTADDLIRVFGDDAYRRGVRMAYEAIQAGDHELSRRIAPACIELIQRGYHKHKRKEGDHIA
jgi:hypothetical protein